MSEPLSKLFEFFEKSASKEKQIHWNQAMNAQFEALKKELTSQQMKRLLDIVDGYTNRLYEDCEYYFMLGFYLGMAAGSMVQEMNLTPENFKDGKIS